MNRIRCLDFMNHDHEFMIHPPNLLCQRMAGAALVVLMAATVDAIINPVVVPATLGTSVTKEVDVNTQMIFEYSVSESGAQIWS